MPKMARRTHRIIHLAKTGHQSIPMGTMVIPEITQRIQMRLTVARVEMVLETETVVRAAQESMVVLVDKAENQAPMADVAELVALGEIIPEEWAAMVVLVEQVLTAVVLAGAAAMGIMEVVAAVVETRQGKVVREEMVVMGERRSMGLGAMVDVVEQALG